MGKADRVEKGPIFSRRSRWIYYGRGVLPISGLEPPSDSREPGYYDDPLGGEYPRWWDGGDWTYQVGPRPEAELRAKRKRTGRRLLDWFWVPVIFISALIEAGLPAKLMILAIGFLVARLLVEAFLRLAPDYRPD